MDTKNKKIDFIGIGVQKSATGWIFERLREHADIRTPLGTATKELHFFSYNYNKGYAWYHRKFEMTPFVTGEFSPSYFPDKNVPERIYRYRPDIKLILSLRNPIDRAFSQHRHQIMRNRLPQGLYDFEEAMQQNPTYIEQGKYASHLERFLEFFERRAIHIILFDDIIASPESCVRRLYRFLEVDENVTPKRFQQKENVSHTFRRPGLERFVKDCSTLLRRFGGETGVQFVKRAGIQTLLRKYNNINIDERIVPKLSTDARRRLYDMFADEIERVSGLIGRDLSSWK